MCLPNRVRHSRHTGAFTLTELMVAMAIVALMAVTLATLTHSVRISNDFMEGATAATQHARVAMERINRAVRDGYANESFPCAAVFSDTIGSYSYPDTLVIWSPTSLPVNTSGLPRFCELVVYCPNPAAANQLLEITAPADTRTVPALTNTTAWNTELTNLKTGNTSTKVLITDLLRTAKPASASTNRGVVQFAVELRPSAAEWAAYRNGTASFASLPWAQSIYGSNSGLRQTWVKSELQLMSGYARTNDTVRPAPLGFFDSASLYWELHP